MSDMGRRAGKQSKIEKLPKGLQEEINKLLRSGEWTYQRIIEAIREDLPCGVELTTQNLSTHWQKRVRPLLENEQAMREALKIQEEMDKNEQVDLSRFLNARLLQISTQLTLKMQEKISLADIDGVLEIDKELLHNVEILTNTLKSLEQSARVNQQREAALQQKERERAVKVVSEVLKTSKGFSREMMETLKRELLR